MVLRHVHHAGAVPGTHLGLVAVDGGHHVLGHTSLGKLWGGRRVSARHVLRQLGLRYLEGCRTEEEYGEPRATE